jgi:hypothetical protein
MATMATITTMAKSNTGESTFVQMGTAEGWMHSNKTFTVK